MAELTQTEFDMLYLRRSVEDCEFILDSAEGGRRDHRRARTSGGGDSCAEEVQVQLAEEARDRRKGQAPEVEPCPAPPPGWRATDPLEGEPVTRSPCGTQIGASDGIRPDVFHEAIGPVES